MTYDDKGETKNYYALNKLLEKDCGLKRTITGPDGRTVNLPANTFVGEYEDVDIEEAIHQVTTRIVLFKIDSGIRDQRVFIVACEKPHFNLLEVPEGIVRIVP